MGIDRAGLEGLYGLAESYMNDAAFRRKVTFDTLLSELFNLTTDMFEAWGASIGGADLSELESRLNNWVNSNAADHELFVPVLITYQVAPAFDIGPVKFTLAEEFFNQYSPEIPGWMRSDFDRVRDAMDAARSRWVASVEVKGSKPERAREIGDVSVDLALTAIQLVTPNREGEGIARMEGRTLPAMVTRLSKSDGSFTVSNAHQAPGLTYGPGELEAYLANGAAVLTSVGGMIAQFLDGGGSLLKLGQAWVDAAYWYHAGLAETLDTIAVPKLETSIEVLLGSESTKGSEARFNQAITVFAGLSESDFIHPDSYMTVKQFAKRFVMERSRILHGTYSTLNLAMGTSRKSLIDIGGAFLREYALELDLYRASEAPVDDLNAFLGWIQVRRQASRAASSAS